MRTTCAAALLMIALAVDGCCKKSPSNSGDAPPPPTAAPAAVPGAVTVGTPVMAPWSRQGKMYGGVVREIYGKLGFVKFNDGDEGWALLEKMRPAGTPQPAPVGDTCAFGLGAAVKAPWSRTHAMYSGVVSEVYGKLARIDFFAGDQGWALCSEMRER